MRPDFYSKSKRLTIYNSIYILKITTLILLVILTAIMGFLFHRYKALFHEFTGESVPVVFVFMAICIVLFAISILLDFHILHKTASFERHLNRLAYLDKLTGLPNRYSCDLLIDSFNNSDMLPNAGFILLRIDNLASVNSDGGHDNGNFLMSEFCNIFEDVSQDYGYVGRNGGNEFIVLMGDCDNTKVEMFLMDLTKRIHGYNEMCVGIPLVVAYSKALNCDEHKEKISELISIGYRRLKENPQILS